MLIYALSILHQCGLAQIQSSVGSAVVLLRPRLLFVFLGLVFLAFLFSIFQVLDEVQARQVGRSQTITVIITP